MAKDCLRKNIKISNYIFNLRNFGDKVEQTYLQLLAKTIKNHILHLYTNLLIIKLVGAKPYINNLSPNSFE
jgi:hypothetical protein